MTPTNVNVMYLSTEIMSLSKPNCLLQIIWAIFMIAGHGYIVTLPRWGQSPFVIF